MMSPVEKLAALSPEDRAEALEGFTDEQALELIWCWEFWARPEQLAPAGNWKTWLVLSGRGWGKTRAGAEWVRSMVCGDTPLAGGRASRVALVAETAADARDVLVEGESGILAVHPPDFRPKYEPSKRRLTWPNGTIATLYNGSEPDQLRGPQHDGALIDEISKYRYAQETWDMLQFGLRLGDDPRQMVTTTPRPIPLLKQLLSEPTTIVTRGRTLDNAANLAPSFIEAIENRYAGTRLGRQELDAEILDDAPDALWRRAKIDETRVGIGPDGTYTYKGQPFELPAMQRVVVGIDPAASEGGTGETGSGAETGIIVAGLGVDGRGYVIDDLSCALAPDGWARRAIAGFDQYFGDLIVAEVNQGGAMVEAVIRSVRPTVPVHKVHASRGKVTRAEPISALYEQGRVSHVGSFPALEDQLVIFTPFGIAGGTTADRVDALVWALTQLFPSMIRPIDTKPPEVFGNSLLMRTPTVHGNGLLRRS